jgi:ubiquinone biosynthesis protein UbiJ
MSSPPFLDGLLDAAGGRLAPPPWAVHEIQHRLVLLLNHVLMQEPEAMDRLRRQSGRVLEGRWRLFTIRLRATPAGLLDLAPAEAAPDLTLTLTDDNPLAVAQALLQGRKPAVRIAGDVQFAAEVNWLVDHVRWDLEEDLARLVGDALAHALGQAARGMAAALRRFVPGAAPAGPGTA